MSYKSIKQLTNLLSFYHEKPLKHICRQPFLFEYANNKVILFHKYMSMYDNTHTYFSSCQQYHRLILRLKFDVLRLIRFNFIFAFTTALSD